MWYIILIFIGSLTYAQQCPTLTEPLNGATEVPVDSPIRWNAVEGEIGYVISLGTSPGTGDIINQRSSGASNFYIPEVGLPENTTIYATIKLFVFGQGEITCTSEIFVTEDVTTPPACTSLTLSNQTSGTPASQNVIRWNYAPKAVGYRMSVGTNQNADNIISDLDVGNVLSYDLTGMLNNDSSLFVRIVPYNENGSAADCAPESLTIDTTTSFCESYFDSSQGGIVDRSPQIEIQEVLGICRNNLPTMVTGEGVADGFRWFKINDDGTETLISENAEAPISEIGHYRLEGYNNFTHTSNTFECSTSRQFTVVLSEPASIEEIVVDRNGDTRSLEVLISGNGDYEYAIDNADGPYQPGNVFTDVIEDRHTIYVRDKKGCGISSQEAPRDLSQDNFPNFFTPNGDGINDFWQFIKPAEISDILEVVDGKISIFNRYGILLVEIDPESRGWDGSFNGRPLPSSDYWFKAVSFDQKEIKGHFSLKR